VTVGETFWAKVIASAMASPFGVGGSAFRTISNKTMLTDTVAFAAYDRAIIARAGPLESTCNAEASSPDALPAVCASNFCGITQGSFKGRLVV